jgi:hypothetical protein
VRSASILLFVTAALQILLLLAYYGIEYAINAKTAAADLSNGGVGDAAFFGVVAVLCGILGILVARGNRIAVWFVWVFGLLGVPFAALATIGEILVMTDPTESHAPVALVAVTVAYLFIASFALAASAALLLDSKARDFVFKNV